MPQPQTTKPWMGPLPASPGCDCHICRPDDSYAGQDRRTIDAVLEHGWQVLFVADDTACENPGHHDHDDGGSTPAFAYTVGLGHRCGHPELLMSGLDPHVMHHALNTVALQVMAGRRFAAGDVLEGVLAGVPVVLETVTDEGLGEAVIWSGWFHRRRPEALMIVWPTTSGLFAWQPGAPAVLDEVQPRVWREPVVHRGGVAVDPPWPFPVHPDHRVFSCTHVVDHGEAVLWAARQSVASRGEDWSIHCGAPGHDTDDMRMVHLAHLVRSAPSLRAISGLALDEQALRADVHSAWQTARLF